MEILLISIWEFFKTAGLAVFSLGFFVMLGALAMFDGLKKMEQNGIDTDGVLYDDKDNPSTDSGQALEDNSIKDKHALKEPPFIPEQPEDVEEIDINAPQYDDEEEDS